MPFGQPFLEGLARVLLDGTLFDIPADDMPSALADVTLILPTRRAERALGEALLKQSDQMAIVLPKIRTVSERDETEALFTPFMAGNTIAEIAGGRTAGLSDLRLIAPPIPPTERLFVLMQLVKAWAARPYRVAEGQDLPDEVRALRTAEAASASQALMLAAELARLMDMVETEGVKLDAIAGLVPESLSAHWQETLSFLQIATAFWPDYVAASGRLTAVERRNELIRAEAERIRTSQTADRIVMAGVTGSIPATVELMAAVLDCPGGAVILPGFDQFLAPDGWDALGPVEAGAGSGNGGLPSTHAASAGEASARAAGQPPNAEAGAEAAAHPEHAQFGFKRVFHRLNVSPSDVNLIGAGDAPEALVMRGEFLSEALRPARATDHWRTWTQGTDPAMVRSALADVHLIEAANAQEEAEAISLIIRLAVEDRDTRVALITPDRLLARRIATRLETWGIRVDDTAGRPFEKTVPGAFLNLVITAVETDFQPAATMALLKHPLCRLGLEARDIREAARALELMAFRSVYTGSGVDGIVRALKHFETSDAAGERVTIAARRLGEEARARALDLAERLSDAVEPITALFRAKRSCRPGELLTAHVAAAEALCRLPMEEAAAAPETAAGEKPAQAEAEVEAMPAGEVLPPDASPLYEGEAGQQAAVLIEDILANDGCAPEIEASDYPEFYRALMSGHNVLPRVPLHPQVSIMGIMEARLLSADIVILGGLNEGVWPDLPDPGPWLNRPMRQQIGLPQPEDRIGYAAHDFFAFCGADKLYLTRARKADGAPTVASRWLLRMEALLAGLGIGDALDTDQPWLAWARSRDFAERVQAASAPRPCPPVEARPRRMSVSMVEKWLANPYAVYASAILKLEKLPTLGRPPDNALKGMIVHEALSRFARRHPDALPADIAGELMRCAEDFFEAYGSSARVVAFWKPRLARFAHWFAETEQTRRAQLIRTYTEISGAMQIAAPGGPFELTARADRIDMAENGFSIFDYKTGAPPKSKAVETGRFPQLPLEAAMMAAGGRAGAGEREVVSLRYIHASGAEPPGREEEVCKGRIEDVSEQALSKLRDLITRFDRDETPYTALRRGGFDYRYDDYEHLARVAEWAAAEAEAAGAGNDTGGQKG